jgi:hypothetical protein
MVTAKGVLFHLLFIGGLVDRDLEDCVGLGLTRSLTKQDDANRLKQDHDVKQKTCVLDII